GQNRNNNNMNRFSQNQNNRGGQNNNNNGRSNLQMPTNYAVAFNFPTPGGAKLSQKLSTELSKSRGITAMGPIAVRMEGSTAILRGTVANEHDRDLAARLALLEPGVYQIRNELRLPSQPVSQPQPQPNLQPQDSAGPPAVPPQPAPPVEPALSVP